MSEQQPNQGFSNSRTILFMVVLSFVSALILSLLASALEQPKVTAKELDRSKQMMIAAKILSHEGYFIIQDAEGKYIPAKYENQVLIPGATDDKATQEELLNIYNTRLTPYLINEKGELKTFKEVNLEENSYIDRYRKTGYYLEALKLVYAILPNETPKEKKSDPIGYVIPVNGFGLWDAIYGYIALKPDANTVIGISWYDQKETPGLGANISEAPWQNLFPGKRIFQETSGGKTDYKTSPIGITVVKGKVSEVLGDSPKAKSAVDGMAGATLTGNGVTDAYKAVLNAYRPFLIRAHEMNSKEKNKEEQKQG